MKILVLSCNTFPYPPSRGAAEGRTFNLLKYLHQRHEVTLVTQRQHWTSEENVEALRQWVSHLMVFPGEQSEVKAGLWSKVGRFVESVAKTTPPNVLKRYSPEVQAWVDTFVAAGKCDAIACEHSVNEVYIRPEFRQSVQTVVDVHSSVYGWVLNHLEHGASENPLRDRLYLPLLYRYEKRYCAKFSSLVATTEDDRQKLAAISPGSPITVVSNGVDLEMFPYRPGDPEGQRLVFVGAMDSSHNIDAARFFALEVFPQVRQRYPEATLSLVGARPVPEVLALKDEPGVIVTGKVPSMVEYMHQATVCVVPLRVGLGIKTKTLESMAAGVPIVASDRGLEGLTVDGANVPLRALRANSVAEYVSAISQLFENPALRAELSQNARSMIETDYTWERAGQLYEQALLQA